MPKILVLVLSHTAEPWRTLEQVQRETWASLAPELGIEVLFLNNDPKAHPASVAYRVGDKIFAPCRDGLYDIGHKTLLGFEHCLRCHEFDYIFRTNSSSYVDLPVLQRACEGFPRNLRYSGVHMSFGPVWYASGCGYTISRDLVEKVVAGQDQWDHTLIDDVSLGKLIHQLTGVTVTPAPRLDLTGKPFTVPQVREFLLTSSLPGTYYHYRCRSRDRAFDQLKLRALHEILHRS
jgi:hypothetical protein